MKHKSFSHMNCSIAQTLEVVGERWTLLIIRDAFRGANRFEDFLHTGISRNILTERLKRLTEYGIFDKRAIDGRSFHYVLTAKGTQLQPILLSITHWGDSHMSHPNGVRSVFIEKKTGRPIAPMSAYSDDGRALHPSEVGIKPGPGSDPSS